ncbi:ABC transporter permease [Chitiniphilus purpureus]|uniref:ABC transporter permease n=1 Tax=Chitiniphilus purpureus TaxID=2981137 RepID=A0ABY6DN62_9NEIS|nr:ABC transporter permease [Chitiniphilus sp. CD1]UXY15807.1 ABC transporter permease [Chitiniphilus sp. CD1]
MKAFFSAWRRLVLVDCRSKLESRADFVLILLGMFFTSVSSAATIYLMLGASNTIAGYNRYELIFMQGFMFMAYVFESSCCNAMYMLESWLKNGNFVRYYLRPIHPLQMLILERFHPQGLIVAITGISFLSFAVAHLPGVWSSTFLLHLLILLPLASITLNAINQMSIASCFFFGEHSPVFHTVGKLTDMSRYPFELFPKMVRQVFMLLPLAGIVWWPCQVLLRQQSIWLVAPLMLLIAAGSVTTLIWLWQLGMRRYAGAGG